MKKNETMYIIFNVSDGPKVITETLNTKGQDGGWVATAINVGGDKLCMWMNRSIESKSPDPEAAEKSKLSELWADITGDEN